MLISVLEARHLLINAQPRQIFRVRNCWHPSSQAGRYSDWGLGGRDHRV